MKPLFGGYVTLDRHEYIMVCETWDEALKELHWIADQGEEVYYLHDNVVTHSQKVDLQDYLTDIYRAWIN